ncbi:MAG: carboxypeptidase regulatory-like domain-containing protein, partial [Actinobacteria bacterium]|nr:carboxypeptidase regulatory-like domain-containing protein [Actinomycetota bacterium]NIU69056.1 carboxypeptidase regulatory-like domain-containing protein [Actinomycetota bacterium]NIW30915.1 hypothetical protein [Actinomycetota bacterium]
MTEGATPTPTGSALSGAASPPADEAGEDTEDGEVIPEILAFQTDEEGRFEIRGIPAGRYQVVGRHPEHAPGIGDPFVIAAGQHRRDERLVLPAGATIDGRVVDGRGYPVAQ